MTRWMRILGLSLCIGASAVGCRPEGDAVTPGEGEGDSSAEDAPMALVWPDEKFRYTPPEPGPIAELSLPKLENFSLDNGIEVYLMQQKVLPTVYMSLQFEMGEVSDPASKIGMTSLCMDLLSEGTEKRDKVAFEEKQADHAVSIWSGGGLESSSIGVRGLKKQLGPALDLMAEMLRHPGLRQADLDRIRDRRKARVKQSRATPSSIASRLYPSLVYGAKHPYGRLVTEKSLDAVALSDCKRVVSKLKPKGARLFVIGMATPEEIKKEVGDRLAWWKGNAPKPKKVPRAKPRKGQIIFVHADQANQSQVWVGHPGPLRTADDYEVTEVMAQILGGGFTSRINMNLREDKGFSYGGRGGFRYNKSGGYFVANSAVRADATGQSLREIEKEIQRMRSSDPTEEEVRREIDGRLLALPASFGSATRSSFAFQNLVFYGLPLDWYSTYQDKLKAVDIAAVRQAAESRLQGDGFTVLVVGDANVVLDDLRALAKEAVFGDGGLVIVDADGKPAKAPEPKPASEADASAEKGGEAKAGAPKTGGAKK